MTEQQRLWSDKGFLKALEAESERRGRLKELTARAIQERKELETIERNITVSSLGNSAFDQGVEAMARK